MIAELLLEGMARSISSQFGEGYTIYTEHVEQGFSEPCFYLKLLSSSRTEFMAGRHKRQYLLDLHFFPKNGVDDRNLVAGELYALLRYLKVTDAITLLGKEMHTSTEDGVLHFFVTYDWIAKESKEEIPMEILQYEDGVK